MAQKGQILRRPGPMSVDIADAVVAAKALGVDFQSQAIKILSAPDLSSFTFPEQAYEKHLKACLGISDDSPKERAELYDSCQEKITAGTLLLILKGARQADGSIKHFLYTGEANEASEATEDDEDDQDDEASAAKASAAKLYKNCNWTLRGRYFDPTYNDYNNPH